MLTNMYMSLCSSTIFNHLQSTRYSFFSSYFWVHVIFRFSHPVCKSPRR